MGKFKFSIAVALCAALIFVPLAGMAENPLPVGDNADGHPWDDQSGNNDTPGGPVDTTKIIDVPAVKVSYPGGIGSKPLVSFLRFALTGKMLYLWF